jgi:hypothetical protein
VPFAHFLAELLRQRLGGPGLDRKNRFCAGSLARFPDGAIAGTWQNK